MLEEYIKETVKKELAKQKLNGMYGKNKQELKQENEKLKKELRDSKNGLNGANHVIKNNKEWINSQDKLRLLKSDKEDLQYNLRRKSTQKIQLEAKNKYLEQENEKLKLKVDEYYNKFLSEGIKKEKAQELIRKIKEEIVLQCFDQDDFFSPEQTFYRIKNILKES